MNANFKPTRRTVVQGAGALVIGIVFNDQVLAADGPPPPAAPSPAPPAPPFSLIDPTQLDSWLAVDAEGKVTVYYGKIDVGQGTDVAMQQMVAEELDVPFESVVIKMDDMLKTVNQGDISGSTAVSNAGLSLRTTAAEARRVLLEQAAQQWGTTADKLSVSDGVITMTGDASKKITYAQLIGAKKFNSKLEWNNQIGNALAVKGQAKIKTGGYKVIGKYFPRSDIPGKVFVTRPYSCDVKVEGMLHGRTIRPPNAGTVPVSVDESSIAGIPGAKVVRKGDFIGVVANKEWDAIQAAEKIKVTWSEPKDVFPEMAQLHTYIRNAEVNKSQDEVNVGDVDMAFAASGLKVVTAEYEWPFQSHASMGPATAVADVKADSATVWTGSPKPHFDHQGVSKLTNLPMDKVHVMWVEGSGSYGRNDDEDCTADAVIMSQVSGKPVRVQYMRADATQWDPKSPASVHTIKAGMDADGKIVAWHFKSKGFSRLEFAQHAANPGDTISGQLTGFKPATPPIFGVPTDGYQFANKRLGWDTIAPFIPVASPLRTTHMRDPLGPQLTFASESFMDECALAAKADPVEYRLKHLTGARDIAVIKAAAEKAGWKSGPHGARRGKKGDIMTGQGIAYAQRSAGFAAAVADVEVNQKTGKVWVKRIVLAQDVGLIINPGTLKSVVEGNVMQSISRTVVEEVQFDKRHVTSVDWVSYPALDIVDAPETIEVVLIDMPNEKSSGAGETAIRMTGAAVANAVFEATGVRIRKAPLTPSRVKAGLA